MNIKFLTVKQQKPPIFVGYDDFCNGLYNIEAYVNGLLVENDFEFGVDEQDRLILTNFSACVGDIVNIKIQNCVILSNNSFVSCLISDCSYSYSEDEDKEFANIETRIFLKRQICDSAEAELM